MENFDLAPIKKEAEEIVYTYQEIQPVKTQEEYSNAGDIVKSLKFKIKKLETKRVEWTKPILDAKKKIDDEFKTIIKPLDEIVGKIENEMKVFWRADQERKNAEQKRIEAEAIEKAKAEGKTEVQVEIVNDKKSVDGEISKTIYQEKWTFEIIDESEVPNIYCSPDKKKIDEAIKNGVREINGLRIFDDGTIISR